MISIYGKSSIFQLVRYPNVVQHRFYIVALTTTHHNSPSLRPYQEECIDICLKKFNEGIRRQAVSLPVGSGKTVIFSHLIQRLPNPTPEAHRVLVLAHREELLDQACQKILQVQPNIIVDIDQGSRNAASHADVLIASVPTLGRKNSSRLEKYNPKEFKLIIIDEAHHVAARSYLSILDYFGALKADSHLKIWGCSATLHRHDGLGLSEVFEQITYNRHMIDMIKDRWLANILSYDVKTNTNINNVRTIKGDFHHADLAEVLNTDARNEMVLQAWQDLAKGKRRSTLIFGVDVRHCYELKKMFEKNGIRAATVHGFTAKDERQLILSDFRAQSLSVLINCGVFTEGTDIPCIDCLILARPTRSQVLFQQMIGRGLRTFANKENCLIIFMNDSYSRHDLASVPTLFGLNPRFLTKGEDMLTLANTMKDIAKQCPKAILALSLDDAKALALYEEKMAKVIELEKKTAEKFMTERETRKRKEKHKIINAFGSILRYDPIDLLTKNNITYEDTNILSKEKFPRNDSQFAWCFLSDSAATIEVSKLGRIIVCQDTASKLFKAYHIYNALKHLNEHKTYEKFHELPLEAESLSFALRAVDTFLINQLQYFPRYLLNSASWRRESLTESQKKILQRMKITEEKINSWTRGDAANFISRIKLKQLLKRFQNRSLLYDQNVK